MKHHTHNSQFHDVTTSQSTITPEKQNTENESAPQQSLTRKERTTHVTQHPNTRHPAASNSNMIDKGGKDTTQHTRPHIRYTAPSLHLSHTPHIVLTEEPPTRFLRKTPPFYRRLKNRTAPSHYCRHTRTVKNTSGVPARKPPAPNT